MTTLDRRPSRTAIWACAEWLDFCIRIGWEKSLLDKLEELWWKHHDDNGNLSA